MRLIKVLGALLLKALAWLGMPLNSSAGSRRTGCAWPACAPGAGPVGLPLPGPGFGQVAGTEVPHGGGPGADEGRYCGPGDRLLGRPQRWRVLMHDGIRPSAARRRPAGATGTKKEAKDRHMPTKALGEAKGCVSFKSACWMHGKMAGWLIAVVSRYAM